MASKREFVEFVAEQLSGAGNISYRKMFGEYGLYLDGKYFGLVCDDQLFIKVTEAVKKQYLGLPQAPPYEGAKNCFLIEELDDRELLKELVLASCAALPEPKPKKAKIKKEKES